MSISRTRLSALVAALLLAVAGVRGADAQGVTTGAITGRVTETGGQPVAGAQVQVRNRGTGFSRGALTTEAGRYTVLGLEPGAYDVTVRRIGFEPKTVQGVQVTLSQTTPVDVDLASSVTQLEAVTVVSETPVGAVITPSRTGATTTITDSLMARLPTLNRNFTDFVRLTPQVSSGGPGLSGGGTNNRYNSIQIDGATESDLFGLGSTGQPGGQAGGKSIAVESVKQYQVLLSPYDVRQGNFSGALINAVTKSGSNDLFGSVYAYGRNETFTRSQPYINEFEQAQYGFSLGGPIVKDRVLFFVNPEFQTRRQPAAGPYIGDPRTKATQADIDRITAALASRGMTALGGGEQVTIENPLTNVFGRLDFNFGNHQLVLRHNYGKAEDDIFGRSTTGTTPTFQLSGNGYAFRSVKNATVAQLRSNFSNGAFNELILGYTTIRDKRVVPANQPQVEISVSGTALYQAGSERSSQANSLDQDVIELTNNFTFPVGTHRFTVGTQNQYYEPVNVFGQQRFGRWEFSNLANLEAGVANRYSVGVPLRNDGKVTFRTLQLSGYLQDEWQATPNLRLTFGVRADMPTFQDEPPFNQAVATEFDGRRTDEIATGNIQWSPRFGFNWDVTGDARNQIRGGAGLFTGRPAFVWLSNAFQNSGLSGYAQLVCNPVSGTRPTEGVPAFTAANVANAPQQCVNGLTAAAGGEINLISPDFKFPQNFRATLGYDRDLGDGWVATLEGLYTRGVNNIFYRNIALANQAGIGTGANGRTVYGTAPNTPTRRTGTSRNVVLEAVNEGEEYSYSATAGVTRRFRDNFEGSVFYTYSRAFDTQSLTSSTSFSQYRFGRVVGGGQGHASTEATPSRWDQPSRVVANATYSFPTKTDLSVIWVGESGGRLDYVYQRDLNGDGFESNDPIYVPRDARNASEIQFASFTTGGVTYTPAQQAAAFNSFIDQVPCLRENRGNILPRLRCKEPFTNRIDVSLRQSLPTWRGQSLSVAVDVINFGNLLNDNWGQVPLTSGTPVNLLSSSTTLVGGTLNQGGQPLYTFDPTQQRFNSARLSSNYQMQLSVRYAF